MNKKFLFLLLSFFSLLFASCSHSDDPEPDTPQTSAKSVFVFMPYTGNKNGGNSLYKNLLINLRDMERAIVKDKGLGNASLVAFISQDARTSRLISISYAKGKCVRDTLKTYTNYDYTSTDGLTSVIADMKRFAPADVYSLIVGCHGEEWLPASTYLKFFGGLRFPIEISNLAAGIRNNGIKMQYILFDDCYMSSIEVAYDLRGATDYLVASTSEMMDYGMPYYRIMHQLLALTPDWQVVCDEFLDFYKSYRMPYGTIGVTDVNYVDDAAVLMKSVNASYAFNPADVEKLQDLDVMHFEPTVYFDFGSYFKNLCSSDKVLMADYDAVVKKLVPYKAATQYIYSYDGEATKSVSEFSGITISDPSENPLAVDSKKLTNWWIATH